MPLPVFGDELTRLLLGQEGVNQGETRKQDLFDSLSAPLAIPDAVEPERGGASSVLALLGDLFAAGASSQNPRFQAGNALQRLQARRRADADKETVRATRKAIASREASNRAGEIELRGLERGEARHDRDVQANLEREFRAGESKESFNRQAALQKELASQRDDLQRELGGIREQLARDLAAAKETGADTAANKAAASAVKRSIAETANEDLAALEAGTLPYERLLSKWNALLLTADLGLFKDEVAFILEELLLGPARKIKQQQMAQQAEQDILKRQDSVGLVQNAPPIPQLSGGNVSGQGMADFIQRISERIGG